MMKLSQILQVELNSSCRKYKESAHMTCLENTISQPSFDFSPIWIPLTSKEVNKQHGMTMDSGIKTAYCIDMNARQL